MAQMMLRQGAAWTEDGKEIVFAFLTIAVPSGHSSQRQASTHKKNVTVDVAK